MRLKTNHRSSGTARQVLSSGAALFFGALLTVALFLILPVLENVGRQEKQDDVALTAVDAVEPPPPDTVTRPEEPPAKEEEPPPPELGENAPPLDLAQLELALGPATGDGFGGDFAVKLASAGAGDKAAEASDEIFALADLDQMPRVSFQPAPTYPPDLKKKKQEGTVYVLFLVDIAGRVQNPKVQKSTHPGFEKPALDAVRRWRFEPGKKGGKPVQFRMRVPITFAL